MPVGRIRPGLITGRRSIEKQRREEGSRLGVKGRKNKDEQDIEKSGRNVRYVGVISITLHSSIGRDGVKRQRKWNGSKEEGARGEGGV